MAQMMFMRCLYVALYELFSGEEIEWTGDVVAIEEIEATGVTVEVAWPGM